MPDGRPPIPADLHRRVLLEAGHRCAVPACKYPQVDVHHIVAWKKCREHRFENLIALCPNCHRMANRGDIDRKALLMYKARLTALFGPELLFSPGSEDAERVWISSSADDHSTAIFSASSSEENYELQIEYPQFHADEALSLNRTVRQCIERAANDAIGAAKDPERFSTQCYNLVGSFHIALRTALAVSLRFSFTRYCGGAHGRNWTEVINYRSDQGAAFGIDDLFAVPDLGIKKLSEYSVAALLGQDGSWRDQDLVRRGAGPDPQNFVNFNLSTEGVLLVFDEYQVGCYAEGKLEVIVPYEILRPIASDFLKALIAKYGGLDA